MKKKKKKEVKRKKDRRDNDDGPQGLLSPQFQPTYAFVTGAFN